VGEIEEERPAVAGFDKGNRAFGVLASEQCLVFSGDFRIDDVVVFVKWKLRPRLQTFFHGQMEHFRVEGPHVVAPRQPEIVIESLLQRKKLLGVSEVPFAKTGRGIALAAAEFGDRGFGGVQSIAGPGSQCPLNADPHVIAAGQQTGAGSGADSLGDVEVGEASTGGGELVEVWSERRVAAERANVSVAHVIHKNDNDVWPGVAEGGTGGGRCRNRRAVRNRGKHGQEGEELRQDLPRVKE